MGDSYIEKRECGFEFFIEFEFCYLEFWEFSTNSITQFLHRERQHTTTTSWAVGILAIDVTKIQVRRQGRLQSPAIRRLCPCA